MKKKKSNSRMAGIGGVNRNTSMLIGNPVWRAMAKESTISQKTQTSMGLGTRMALHALTHGEGQLAQVKELLVTAFAGMCMAEQGCGHEFVADFEASVAALLESIKRALQGAPMNLTETEATQVNQMLSLHEEQVQLADRAMVSDAIMESYRRVSEALSPANLVPMQNSKELQK